MQQGAFRSKEAKFTADLWKFTFVTDSTGSQTRAYSLSRSITFSTVTGNFGKVECYFQDSENDVIQYDQLQNFRAPDGNELFSNGVWQIEQIAPYINLYGKREGFRARLSVVAVS